MPKSKPVVVEKWHTDADTIAPADIASILFVNNAIWQFLALFRHDKRHDDIPPYIRLEDIDHRDDKRDGKPPRKIGIRSGNKHFVVATKGVGKTLLLKFKRFLLDRLFGSEIIFIPQDTPYLDHISKLPGITKKHGFIIGELSNSRTLWSLCIMISALSFYQYNTKTNSDLSAFSSELEEAESKYGQRYKKYIEYCRGKRPIPPCAVVSDVLSMSYNDIIVFLDKYYSIVEQLYKSIIRSGVFLFIDRIDQSLNNLRNKLNIGVSDIVVSDNDSKITITVSDIWVYFQAGLIEAAWDLMRNNNHVKIYTSIRREAYFSYHSSDKEAIYGDVTFAEYDNDQLLSITNRGCKFYEDEKDIYSFIGFKAVFNMYTLLPENCFRYIQRHTIDRPRDLVAICLSLSSKRPLIPESFRYAVNTTSHHQIARNIFKDIGQLFHSIVEKDKREEFLSLIPQNVLNKKLLIDICRKFNGRNICNETDCSQCDGYHSFCDLYNAGLLGVLEQGRTAEHKYVQKFLGPYKTRSFGKRTLPSTHKYYLIHPCLEDYISEVRNKEQNETYDLVKYVLVGHNYDWHDRFDWLTEIHNLTNNISDQSLRDAIRDAIDIFIGDLLTGNINKEEAYIKIDAIPGLINIDASLAQNARLLISYLTKLVELPNISEPIDASEVKLKGYTNRDGSIKKTLLQLDMYHYTQVVRILENTLGSPKAVALLNGQIRDFVNQGLERVGSSYNKTVMTGTKHRGDGVLLGFDDPNSAHTFAETFHEITRAFNEGKNAPLEKRIFRIGIATGDIFMHDRAGGKFIDVARLEAAANPGGILIDKDTFNSLLATHQDKYNEEEEVEVTGKNEKFKAHRSK